MEAQVAYGWYCKIDFTYLPRFWKHTLFIASGSLSWAFIVKLTLSTYFALVRVPHICIPPMGRPTSTTPLTTWADMDRRRTVHQTLRNYGATDICGMLLTGENERSRVCNLSRLVDAFVDLLSTCD